MDSTTLQLFSRQIVHWAETVINSGRHPFRRVETDPLLLTAGGECRPPVVFWINRESYMAGGVLLLPQKEAEDEIEMGRQCASALGLRHFVTWAAREIVFWEEQGNAVVRYKTFPLKGRSATAAVDFQNGVTTVLEQMKVLCVLGTVPPLELSPYCLANLSRRAVERVLPRIEEECRLGRTERPAEGEISLEQSTIDKGLTTLTRLLGLLLYDRLPNTIQPEGLERAMLFAIETLPQTLRSALQPSTGEGLLSAECAIHFHRLLRRLTQLQCGADRQRAALVLEILLDHYSRDLGAATIPAVPERSNGLVLLINPSRPYPGGPGIVEVGTPASLAMLALLREVRMEQPAHFQSTDPLAIAPPLTFSFISGSLRDHRIPDKDFRRILTARLRSSWPTRRFVLPRRTPVWAWTFIHTLGLADKDAQIRLDIPEEWLFETYGEALHQLLAQEYVLHSIERRAGELRLIISREKNADAICSIEGPDGLRQVPCLRIGTGHRAIVRLALDLPANLFGLLQQESLRFPEEVPWPEAFEREVLLFTRSGLGALLWGTVSNGHPLPSERSLQRDITRYGLPLPRPSILADLHRIPAEETDKLTQAVFEAELSRMLGLDHMALPKPARKSRTRTAVQPADEACGDMAAQITARVFTDGLPRFPEQYLYNHYRPALREYSFHAPLQIHDEFFGRVQLIDQQGERLEVEGQVEARALLLASFGNSTTTRLPIDPQLTTTILTRYLADLNSLHRELKRQCHLQVAEQSAADALVESIWRSLALPPREMCIETL